MSRETSKEGAPPPYQPGLWSSSNTSSTAPRSRQDKDAVNALIKHVADGPTALTALLPALTTAAGAYCLSKPDSDVFTSSEAGTHWGIGLLVVTGLLAMRALYNAYQANKAKTELINTHGMSEETINDKVKSHRDGDGSGCGPALECLFGCLGS